MVTKPVYLFRIIVINLTPSLEAELKASQYVILIIFNYLSIWFMHKMKNMQALTSLMLVYPKRWKADDVVYGAFYLV